MFKPIVDPADGVQLSTLISPNAASWLFERTDARLRQLAIAGEVPTAPVENLGGKPSRFYDFDALCDRFGEPDPSRLHHLRQYSYVHAGGEADGYWTLIVKPPRVAGAHSLDLTKPRRLLAVDEIGRLAIYEKDSKHD